MTMYVHWTCININREDVHAQKILGNYRPISIIPTFAKIIETHVKSHLLKYLEDHSLLSKLQFECLSGSSTETVLHNIVDNTLMNLDKGSITALCLLDLTKGFDTVSHEILLHKLEKYGITGNAFNCFTSYLSNVSSLSNITILSPNQNIFTLEFHRAQFRALFYSYYILMI